MEESEITVKDIETVLINAPDLKTFGDAKNALMASKNDIIEAIAILWKIEKPAKIEKEKTKIDELREICQEFDLQMQDVVKKSKE